MHRELVERHAVLLSQEPDKAPFQLSRPRRATDGVPFQTAQMSRHADQMSRHADQMPRVWKKSSFHAGQMPWHGRQTLFPAVQIALPGVHSSWCARRVASAAEFPTTLVENSAFHAICPVRHRRGSAWDDAQMPWDDAQMPWDDEQVAFHREQIALHGGFSTLPRSWAVQQFLRVATTQEQQVLRAARSG